MENIRSTEFKTSSVHTGKTQASTKSDLDPMDVVPEKDFVEITICGHPVREGEGKKLAASIAQLNVMHLHPLC